jgi:hypothetical protein
MRQRTLAVVRLGVDFLRDVQSCGVAISSRPASREFGAVHRLQQEQQA